MTTTKSPARTAAERKAEAKAAPAAQPDTTTDVVDDTTTAVVDDTPPVVPPPGASADSSDMGRKLDALLGAVENLAAKVDQAATVEHVQVAVKTGLEGVAYTAEQDKREMRAYVDDRMNTMLEVVEELRGSLTDRVLAEEMYADQGTAAQGTVERVHATVLAVMKDVRSIGKDGRMDPQQRGPKYPFRRLDDVMDSVGASMRDHGLYVLPSILDKQVDRWVADGKTVTSVIATVKYTFVAAADGSTVEFTMIGEGRDNGDKATSKAVAMAFKYALLQALCIPVENVTGMDSEAFDPPTSAPDRPRQSQQYQQAVQGAAERAQGQAVPPPPNRQAPAPGTPLESATRALAAARRATNEDQLNSIGQHAAKLGILDTVVEDQPLRNHLWACAGLLTGTMPPPPASPRPAALPPQSPQGVGENPPADAPDDPWGSHPSEGHDDWGRA